MISFAYPCSYVCDHLQTWHSSETKACHGGQDIAGKQRLVCILPVMCRVQDHMPAQIYISFARSISHCNTTSLSFVDGCFGADLLLRILAIFLPVPKPAQSTPDGDSSLAEATAPADHGQAGQHASSSQHGPAAVSGAEAAAPPSPADSTQPATPSGSGPQADLTAPENRPQQQAEAPPVKTARFSLNIARCRIACHDWRVPAASRRPGMLALALDLPDLVLQLPMRQPLQHPSQHAVQLASGDAQEAPGAPCISPQQGQLAPSVQAAFATRYAAHV